MLALPRRDVSIPVRRIRQAARVDGAHRLDDIGPVIEIVGTAELVDLCPDAQRPRAVRLRDLRIRQHDLFVTGEEGVGVAGVEISTPFPLIVFRMPFGIDEIDQRADHHRQPMAQRILNSA